MPFKILGLHPLLVQACREMHYTEPTPVQAARRTRASRGRCAIPRNAGKENVPDCDGHYSGYYSRAKMDHRCYLPP